MGTWEYDLQSFHHQADIERLDLKIFGDPANNNELHLYCDIVKAWIYF